MRKTAIKNDFGLGTVRIKAKDLSIVEKTASGWKESSKPFPNAMDVIFLFKKNNRFKCLIDKKDPAFLKGCISPDGLPQGARIKILPDGSILDKAFSLFSPHLTIHDQQTHDHWDVIYQNKGGTFSYDYTLEKKKANKNKKYKMVEEFAKKYPKLKKNVSLALKDENDAFALPLYTLLETHIRVGNEIYYKAHGHKGLTTLKKKDISIKGNWVTFNFVGKDGVPIKMTKKFPEIYIKRLKSLTNPMNPSSFVFVGENGHPIAEPHFKKAFKKYCGKEFYPHIVRSYYATSRVKDFIRKTKKPTKEQVNSLFLSIASDLGHKKFIKDENVWREHIAVTVNNYIQPELVDLV